MRWHRATGHAGQGDSVGPPHPHTRAHGMWVTDPDSTPRARAVGGGGAPDQGRSSQRRKATPLGTLFRHPHSEQRQPARAHALGPVLGPHDRTDRTQDTQVAEPRLPAPEDGRLGEGQRLRPDAPRFGGRPPPPRGRPPTTPRHAAPTKHEGQGDSVGPPQPHDRAHSTWVAAPNSPPSGRAVGGGTASDTRRPSQRWQATTPGDGPPPPPRHAAPTGHAGHGDSVGPPHLTPAPTARGWRTPTARPVGGQSGEGQRLTSDATHNGGRHPPQGGPSASPTTQARKGAPCGGVLGPHARTDRTRDTLVTEPQLPASEDGRPGEGQRLTSDAPHNGGRSPPPGDGPPAPPRHAAPRGHAGQGDSVGPPHLTPAPTARGWRTPTARPVGGQSGEGQRLTSDAPHIGGRTPPRGRPSATPTASNAGPQGRTLWSRCWVPTPAPTAPGTHGLRSPGCPLQRTGGWGRDSA